MHSLIKTTRNVLGLSQVEFGRWAAEKIGRVRPFPTQRISEWERGIRSPRKNVRDVCLPIVAAEIADDAAGSMKNGDPIDTVRDNIESRIIECTR